MNQKGIYLIGDRTAWPLTVVHRGRGQSIGDALCPKVMPGAEEELRDVSFLLKKS
jgi:hypothetical protein